MGCPGCCLKSCPRKKDGSRSTSCGATSQPKRGCGAIGHQGQGKLWFILCSISPAAITQRIKVERVGKVDSADDRVGAKHPSMCASYLQAIYYSVTWIAFKARVPAGPWPALPVRMPKVAKELHCHAKGYCSVHQSYVHTWLSLTPVPCCPLGTGKNPPLPVSLTASAQTSLPASCVRSLHCAPRTTLRVT